MPTLRTPFLMLKQSEPNWCWLATTTSIYNFYMSKTDGAYASISTEDMFKLVKNNTDVKAKYDKGGRDFSHKPKDCLSAVDCLAERPGHQTLDWSQDLTGNERLGIQSGARARDGSLSPAHLKLQQAILRQPTDSARLKRLKILEAMKAEISSDRPVLCCYRPEEGGTGHAMVMVGFNGNEIICKDPMLGEEGQRTLDAVDVYVTPSGNNVRLVSVCFTQQPAPKVTEGLAKFFSS